MSFWERPPAWYSAMLGGICLAGGVWSAVVGSWVRAGFCFLTVLLCAHAVRRARRVGDEPLTAQRARMSATSLRIRAAIIVVVFTLIAAASVVFLVRADGNVAAYVVGGAILALSLYVAVVVLVRWRKVTRPSQGAVEAVVLRRVPGERRCPIIRFPSPVDRTAGTGWARCGRLTDLATLARRLI